METQNILDVETIRVAIAGKAWALEKVLVHFDDEITRMATVRVHQPDGSITAIVDEDMRQEIILHLLETIPQFPIKLE